MYRIRSLLLCSGVVYSAVYAAESVPRLSLRLEQSQVLEGEPLIVELRVHNASGTNLMTKYCDAEDFSDSTLSVELRDSSGLFFCRWRQESPGGVSAVRSFPPGAELKVVKVVFGFQGRDRTTVVLVPGQYSIVAACMWEGELVESEPAQLTVLSSTDRNLIGLTAEIPEEFWMKRMKNCDPVTMLRQRYPLSQQTRLVHYRLLQSRWRLAENAWQSGQDRRAARNEMGPLLAELKAWVQKNQQSWLAAEAELAIAELEARVGNKLEGRKTLDGFLRQEPPTTLVGARARRFMGARECFPPALLPAISQPAQ